MAVYIDEVIRICDTLYPNPFEQHEKYFWCDELSAMLSQKYAPDYDRTELIAADDGGFLLPEGVTMAHIDRVICGDREIPRQDMRTYGIHYMFSPGGGRLAFKRPSKRFLRMYLVYMRPYEKIRAITRQEDALTVQDRSFILKKNPFRTGDILNIEWNGKTYPDVPVFGVETTDNPEESRVLIGAELPHGTGQAQISRRVTEQTWCPPPYDGMYVDYLIARMCYYQHDYESYAQHTGLFNARLADYEKWLKCHSHTDSGVRLTNWW